MRATLRVVALTVLQLFAATVVIATGHTDQKLLPLVPPGATLVAGMNAPAQAGQPDSFLLLTRNNSLDLAAFLALSGVDDARRIHQVIYVAGGPSPADQGEHSLLVSGQFDEVRIFRAALANGASREEWKGLSVLVVPPFDREKGMLAESRWLVVLRATIAIFGTESSVREELNRALARSGPDAPLMRRLSHLRSQDDAWCAVQVLPAQVEIQRSLQALDPALPGLLHEGDGFAFGIRYGTRVELEYAVTAAKGSAVSISNAVATSLLGDGHASASMPREAERERTHRQKVSRTRYEAWLAEVLTRRHTGSDAATTEIPDGQGVLARRAEAP